MYLKTEGVKTLQKIEKQKSGHRTCSSYSAPTLASTTSLSPWKRQTSTDDFPTFLFKSQNEVEVARHASHICARLVLSGGHLR
jgi:hypothetical protein